MRTTGPAVNLQITINGRTYSVDLTLAIKCLLPRPFEAWEWPTRLRIGIAITFFFTRMMHNLGTSRKRPPKMQRLSSRLQEAKHRGPLPRRGPGKSALWKIIYFTLCLS